MPTAESAGRSRSGDPARCRSGHLHRRLTRERDLQWRWRECDRGPRQARPGARQRSRPDATLPPSCESVSESCRWRPGYLRRVKVGVFGAGSIGCYVGGRLLAANALGSPRALFERLRAAFPTLTLRSLPSEGVVTITHVKPPWYAVKPLIRRGFVKSMPEYQSQRCATREPVRFVHQAHPPPPVPSRLSWR